MGLLDFFKIKSKPKFNIDTETDLRKIINYGILFEDNKSFLRWGVPADVLKNSLDTKKRIFADRTAYNWGEHVILHGLRLELSTIYWDHKEDSQDKLFGAIEFRVTGDVEVDEYFIVIKDHIKNLFGNANEEYSSGTEVIYEWIVIDVKIYLHCYEQHTTNKLHFEISRL